MNTLLIASKLGLVVAVLVALFAFGPQAVAQSDSTSTASELPALDPANPVSILQNAGRALPSASSAIPGFSGGAAADGIPAKCECPL